MRGIAEKFVFSLGSQNEFGSFKILDITAT